MAGTTWLVFHQTGLKMTGLKNAVPRTQILKQSTHRVLPPRDHVKQAVLGAVERQRAR